MRKKYTNSSNPEYRTNAKKKIVFWIALYCATVFSAFCQQYDSVIDFQSEQLPDGGGYAIEKYLGTRQIVRIPPRIRNVNVTMIGAGAFLDHDITSVAIPASVTVIGDAAFFNNSLSGVVVPDVTTSIGALAFWGNNLSEITIPNSVTKIGGGAFASNNITSITIGANVQFVPFDLSGTIYSEVFDNNFDEFYNAQRRRAGRYTFSNGRWTSTSQDAVTTASINIANNTGYTIKTVNLSPVDSDTWGPNRLQNNQTITNGQTVSLQLPHPISNVNRYDIRLEDSDDDVYQKMDILVSNNSTVEFVFRDIRPPITIQNNTGYTVRHIYIRRAGTSSWGTDRSDSGQTFPNRQSFSTRSPFSLNQTDRIDVRIEDTDGDTYTKLNVLVEYNGTIEFVFDEID